jgi:hypothetical protein
MALRSETYSAHASHMNSTAKCMHVREESLWIVTEHGQAQVTQRYCQALGGGHR